MIKKNDKIFLAGHNGLVGSAILKNLKKNNYKNIIIQNRKDLDLFNQIKVEKFLKKKKPKIVIIAAAKVGGIKANDKFRADFIRENLQIQTNIIHSCHLNNINNIIFLGSSCVYPKESKLPIKESYLMTGLLEKTNEPYAVAKIAGIKMCESYNLQYKRNYISLMPTNTFGEGDNYNLNNSHFIPSILRKIYLAKKRNKKHISLWGTGKPKREVIHVDDLASAVVHFMNVKTRHSLINIGTSKEYSIKQYAKMILRILRINLKLKFDNNVKFDGVKSKILDTKLARKYGWRPKISFSKAILKTYEDLEKNYRFIRDN
ncbi:GDP-L-fucose synthase family protein [Candidatus Pelagibacter sp.]|uniref:GDP-L-fucose synthase family protein n=1 Tax=Candidatus Pelagibacter sp. TaxID=2024849 RepID=UPI003F837679